MAAKRAAFFSPKEPKNPARSPVMSGCGEDKLKSEPVDADANTQP